jgi:CheY-like chemotaxis protein
MVHGFAKQSGGHLKVYSEVGLGTVVNLYLPRAVTDDNPEPATKAREGAVSGTGELILVVEDDPNMRGLTLLVLKSLGYRAIEAQDGPAACAILDRAEPIDLLLSDVVLPKGMTGPEIARHAKSTRPDLAILYMSGYPRDAVLRDSILDTRMHLLSKPFSKAELARMVRLVLDERPPT